MLGRRDHSLQEVQKQVGLLEIKARYADSTSSRKLINDRLDKIDRHHVSPTTDL